MLFNIVLESVARGLFDTDAGIRIQNKKINLIAYVDDIVVIGKTEVKIKTLSELLIKRSKCIGLIVNKEKQNNIYYRAKTITNIW